MKASIAAIVTGHREGSLIARSIASATRALARVEASVEFVELIVTLDRSDDITIGAARDAIERAKSTRASRLSLTVLTLDCGDAAESRMAAIRASRARYVALLDGDDLWDARWLVVALNVAATQPDERFVIHPQISWRFGSHHEVAEHIASIDPRFCREALLAQNAWTALAFFPRELALAVPWRVARTADGYGYEDWLWNCETMAAGARHLIAPKTAHFIRVRKDSRGTDHRRLAAILPPNAFCSSSSVEQMEVFSHLAAEKHSGIVASTEAALRAFRRRAIKRGHALAPVMAVGARIIARALRPRATPPIPFHPPKWLISAARKSGDHCLAVAGRRRQINKINLHSIDDPHALSAYIKWIKRFEQKSEIVFGCASFLPACQPGYAQVELRPRGLWIEADGILLTESRLGWLTRAFVQSSTPRLLLEPCLATESLLSLYGNALAPFLEHGKNKYRPVP